MKNKLISEVKKEGFEIKEIFNRIKNRNFSGYEGLAIKNSIFQFSTNVANKLGALAFVIILARFVSPETFGLYNLAFSTIMIFYIFADLGVNQAVIYFISKNLGKKQQKKAETYLGYLFKIKIWLIVVSMAALLILAKTLSDTFYDQPIFLSLILGSFYILFTSIQSFLVAFSHSHNNFRYPFFKDLFLQVSKIIFLIPILLTLNRIQAAPEIKVASIFALLGILSLFSMILIFFLVRKNLSKKRNTKYNLKTFDRKTIKKFVLKFSFIGSVTLLFGHVDKIILGHFVSPEFVGYYSAALNLVMASVFLIVFSDTFFPIFLRINKADRLKKAFRKSRDLTILMSIILFIIILAFPELIINLIFGAEYAESASILRWLSLLAISIPLVELYTSYVISKGNLKKIAILIFFMLIVNILLPYFIISWFVDGGQMSGVFGATLAVIIGKYLHLFSLIFISRKV